MGVDHDVDTVVLTTPLDTNSLAQQAQWRAGRGQSAVGKGVMFAGRGATQKAEGRANFLLRMAMIGWETAFDGELRAGRAVEHDRASYLAARRGPERVKRDAAQTLFADVKSLLRGPDRCRHFANATVVDIREGVVSVDGCFDKDGVPWCDFCERRAQLADNTLNTKGADPAHHPPPQNAYSLITSEQMIELRGLLLKFTSREWAEHIAADYSLELQEPGQVVGCIAELNAVTAEVPLTMESFLATLDGAEGVTRLLPRSGLFLGGAFAIVREFALHRRVCGRRVPPGAEGVEGVDGRASPTGGTDDPSQDRSPPRQRSLAVPPAPAARPRIARKRVITVDSDEDD